MTDLRSLVAGELATPVDPRVAAFAATIAAEYPGASRAVLFYGSCLWTTGGLEGQMLDFYLIVSDYTAAYGRGWFAFANRVLPPNVFPFESGGLAAKYAVLSEADFRAMTSVGARDTSVWARFSQPSRLVWVADEAARVAAIDTVMQAPRTLRTLAAPTLAEGERDDPLGLWRHAYALTYAAELRAERATRSGSIVDADPARYIRFGEAMTALDGPLPAAPSEAVRQARLADWKPIQRRGKRRTLARLAKASTTFAGGIDYLAWKINRHAGADVVIQPWQRRWPLLGAITLLPRLIRGGAVK